MNSISEILGIEPVHRQFEFEGRKFQYHPENRAGKTAEALYTDWADGPRSASPMNLKDRVTLEQQLATVLAHRFRKPPSRYERLAILDRARRALA